MLGKYIVEKGKGIRRVRTPEGARFFDAPIGTPITPGMVAAARARKGKAKPARRRQATSGQRPMGARSERAMNRSDKDEPMLDRLMTARETVRQRGKDGVVRPVAPPPAGIANDKELLAEAVVRWQSWDGSKALKKQLWDRYHDGPSKPLSHQVQALMYAVENAPKKTLRRGIRVNDELWQEIRDNGYFDEVLGSAVGRDNGWPERFAEGEVRRPGDPDFDVGLVIEMREAPAWQFPVEWLFAMRYGIPISGSQTDIMTHARYNRRMQNEIGIIEEIDEHLTSGRFRIVSIEDRDGYFYVVTEYMGGFE